MQKLILIMSALVLYGCATQHTSNRCLTYTISGSNTEWKPMKLCQSSEKENQLYIEIPKSANFIPTLEVIDTEFDQAYKINYTFNPVTKRFTVEDNHDEYLLYRETPDGLHKDKVYITCNRYSYDK